MSAAPAPTTFFREVARNRRDSWLLVVVVALVLGALGGAIGAATGYGWWGVALALVVAGVLSISSYFGGDQLVLSSSGAKEIPAANPPREYQQFVDVVTEMSIAGGLPMPKMYVIDDSAPNAFATGRDPQHASIAATSGLLTKMDREELQGVVAHEMSHTTTSASRCWWASWWAASRSSLTGFCNSPSGAGDGAAAATTIAVAGAC
jgi:heat shock protein HtpX